MAAFLVRQPWGYSQGRNGTREYRVEHPQWKCCVLEEFDINVDFAEDYGDRFAFLTSQSPYNVQYADGSAVTVSFPRRLKASETNRQEIAKTDVALPSEAIGANADSHEH